MDPSTQNINFKKVCTTLCEPLCIFLIISALIFVWILIFKVDINTFLTVATSAFFGAGTAFFLNTFQSKKKQRLKNRASLEKTKYVIEKIFLNSKLIKDHTNKYMNTHDENFFEWEKISKYDSTFFLLPIYVEDLLFLIDHKKDGKETLDSVLRACTENQVLRHILERRNQDFDFYLDKTIDRDKVSKGDLKNIIGTRLFQQLQQYTEALIRKNENLLESCENAKEKINNFLNNY